MDWTKYGYCRYCGAEAGAPCVRVVKRTTTPKGSRQQEWYPHPRKSAGKPHSGR